MIRLTEQLWIGNSDDGGGILTLDIEAVLNVAQDLKSRIGWPHIDYMQVGLVDGPGNPMSSYIAAVLALDALIERRKRALVCCHSGSRSVAVAIMYLSLKEGKARQHPMAWSYWPTWEEKWAEVQGRVHIDLPVPHESHKEVYSKLPFGLLEALI